MKTNKVCGVFDECIPIDITNNINNKTILFFLLDKFKKWNINNFYIIGYILYR